MSLLESERRAAQPTINPYGALTPVDGFVAFQALLRQGMVIQYRRQSRWWSERVVRMVADASGVPIISLSRRVGGCPEVVAVASITAVNCSGCPSRRVTLTLQDEPDIHLRLPTCRSASVFSSKLAGLLESMGLPQSTCARGQYDLL